MPYQEQLGLACEALGDAYMAEHLHADKDCSQALRVTCSLHLCYLSVQDSAGWPVGKGVSLADVVHWHIS